MTLGAMPHTTRIRVPMTAEDPHAPPHESIRGWSSSVKPSVRHSNSTVGAFMNDLSFSKRRSHHGSSQPAPASAIVRGRHHDFVVPAGLPAFAELRRSLPDCHARSAEPPASHVWSCLALVDTCRLCRRGGQMAGRRAPYAPEYRRQMVELVRAVCTPGKFAGEFGCSSQAIRNWVRNNCIKFLPIHTFTIQNMGSPAETACGSSSLPVKISHTR